MIFAIMIATGLFAMNADAQTAAKPKQKTKKAKTEQTTKTVTANPAKQKNEMTRKPEGKMQKQAAPAKAK